jgi:hypothetical protein
MTIIIAAFTDGWRRVLRAPALLAGLWLTSLLMVIPAGLLLEASIAGSLGNSLDAQTMAAGVNSEWWDRFSESASGLTRTFSPTIIGFGAVLDNASRFLDNGPVPAGLLGLAALTLVLWLFVIGGVIDRYARMRPTRSHGFLAACGVYGVRFLRLGIVAALGYAFIVGLVHAWLFDVLYPFAVRNLTVERTAFGLRLGLYGVFLLVLTFWNVVMDYAKIRAVVEDRRSMLGAVLAAWTFVVRHPLKTGGLYAFNVAGFLVVLALYAVVAPGAGGFGVAAWMAFAIGQVYLLARLAVKLAFYASQTALFQRSLAHVAYTAAPEPLWPDSPAAEAITNAAGRT